MTPVSRPFGPRDPAPGPDVVAAYAAGFADGARAQPDRELLVPVPVPWRTVRAEDSIMGDDGLVYAVVRSGRIVRRDGGAGWALTLVCGTYRELIEGDRDDPANVLITVAQADALVLTRAELGASLIATRYDEDGGTTGDLVWRGGT